MIVIFVAQYADTYYIIYVKTNIGLKCLDSKIGMNSAY